MYAHLGCPLINEYALKESWKIGCEDMFILVIFQEVLKWNKNILNEDSIFKLTFLEYQWRNF